MMEEYNNYMSEKAEQDAAHAQFTIQHWHSDYERGQNSDWLTADEQKIAQKVTYK